MDKLAERVGLYDIWTVFFPGTVGILETLVFMGIAYGMQNRSIISNVWAFIPNTISGWIVFFIVSFFFGLVLQEIGRILRRIFKLKDAAKDVLNPDAHVFGEKEIYSLKRMLLQNWESEENAFAWINAKAQDKGIAERYVKLSVLQNMSLSLAAVMFVGLAECILMIFMAIVYGYMKVIIASVVGIVLSVILMIMFIKRSARFNLYWVRNLIYAVAARYVGAEKIEDRNLHEED